MNKNISVAIIIVLLIVIGGGAWYWMSHNNTNQTTNNPVNSPNATDSSLNTQTPTPENNTNNNNIYMIQNMKVEVLQEGSGMAVKTGDQATMNYTGWLQDGTKFDSSLNPGRTPFPFTLGQNRVIQGWELGVLGMKVGEKRKLTIPPELGYGASGNPPVIPANATLIFEVELLKIN